MQRARETKSKSSLINKNRDSCDTDSSIDVGSIFEKNKFDVRHKKVVMMSPRTRERRRTKHAILEENDSCDLLMHNSINNKKYHINEEVGDQRKRGAVRASTLIGLQKIKHHLNTPDKQTKKIKKTPNCSFCFGNDFCDPHMEYIFMDSIVDELIAFTQPIYQSRIPLPDHVWREKYPLELKENSSPEEIIFMSGKMKIMYPQVCFNQKAIYTCDNCLETLVDSNAFGRHTIKCTESVSGTVIYEDKVENLKISRVDGERSKNYCRRLCTIGKLFLEHKTLFYDVEPFLFYVLYSKGHFVGYFSKEKTSKFNLSCIVVLPIFQGKGFGTFMIDASYCLSISRKETGTPEKPLSKQGLASYQGYWKYAIYHELVRRQGKITFQMISQNTGICVNDLVYGLELLGFLRKKNNEYYIQVETRHFKDLRMCNRKCFLK